MKSGGTKRRSHKKGGAYGGPVQYGKPVQKTLPEGTYLGYFLGDKRHGKGIMKYKNKDEYQGEWEDDKRKGRGTMIYLNADQYGDQYQGQWADDKRNGAGVIQYQNKDQYQGEWADDKRQGEGQIFYADDSSYKGHWFQDKRQGEGGMRYPDGSTYIGHWFEDKRQGEGVLYDHNRVEVYRGNWENDEKHSASSASKSISLHSLPHETIFGLPSKVFDIENDNYSLLLSQIDGNQKDTPIVFLAGKDLYVFTANLIRKVLEDNTSILYDCVPNDQGDYETKKDVSYFNLRRLFTMDGLVPLKLLRKTLIPRKKVVAVQQRYHSVTNKINSIANNKTLQLSEKKKNIKELLLDNKLPPVIYTFVPTKKKLSRMMSKAVAASEPDSAIGGFHCQDQGGTQWTVYNIVQVRKGRKKTPKTLKKYSNSARSRTKSSNKSSKRTAIKHSI